jgi:hypothetical protein
MALMIYNADDGLRVLAWIVLAVFLYLVWAIIRGYMKAKDAELWPVVMGTIAESDIHQWIEEEYDSSHCMPRRKIHYEPQISYDYQVEGIHYRGGKSDFEVIHLTGLEHSKRILEKYPAGREVEVHYNPSNHGESVLETAYGSLPTKLALAFSVVIAIVMIILIIRQSAGHAVIESIMSKFLTIL